MTTSPYEPDRPYLVPRYVTGHSDGASHICMSDYRFAEGAIVTLEAVCGEWCFGTLSRMGYYVLRYQQPSAKFCLTCTTRFQERARELDRHGTFRWPGKERT